jgi:hypothetical protein
MRARQYARELSPAETRRCAIRYDRIARDVAAAAAAAAVSPRLADNRARARLRSSHLSICSTHTPQKSPPCCFGCSPSGAPGWGAAADEAARSRWPSCHRYRHPRRPQICRPKCRVFGSARWRPATDAAIAPAPSAARIPHQLLLLPPSPAERARARAVRPHRLLRPRFREEAPTTGPRLEGRRCLRTGRDPTHQTSWPLSSVLDHATRSGRSGP